MNQESAPLPGQPTPGRLRTLLLAGGVLLALVVLAALFVGARTAADVPPGVTAAKLRRIQAGMSPEEVRQILGAPLEMTADPQGLMRWSYSRDPAWALTFPRVAVFVGDAGVDRVAVREQTLWGVDGYLVYLHYDGGTFDYRPNMGGLIP